MPRGSGRPLLVMGGVLVALLAAGAVLSATRRDGVAGRDRPLAYRLVYRVEQRIDEPVVTWEEHVVSRPFRARTATYRRPPDAATPARLGSLTSASALFAIGADGAMAPVAGRVPGVPAGDHALDTVIDAAAGRGLARRLGERTVIGRRCAVYRLAEPPTRPLQRPVAAGDHDDVCVDGAGLILHEEWTLGGRVVLVRTAVELDLDPDPAHLDAALSTRSATGRPPADAPRVEALAPGGEQSFLPAPPVPDGFMLEWVGREVVPPPASLAGDPAGGAFVGTAWVFATGPHLLTVEAIEGVPGSRPWPLDPSVPTDVGALGTAESVLGPDGTELRVDLGGGRWVRVRGTLPPRDVAEYARLLDAPRG